MQAETESEEASDWMQKKKKKSHGMENFERSSCDLLVLISARKLEEKTANILQNHVMQMYIQKNFS